MQLAAVILLYPFFPFGFHILGFGSRTWCVIISLVECEDRFALAKLQEDISDVSPVAGRRQAYRLDSICNGFRPRMGMPENIGSAKDV